MNAMNKPIYLDYAAAPPMDPRVAECMAKHMTLSGNFGNPASRSHIYGWKAEEAVEGARNLLAELIGADSREIVWTSGATEANNLALIGAIEQRLKNTPVDAARLHIVTAQTEHKAVLDTCKYLETRGCEVTYLAPNGAGIISLDDIKAACREETAIVSIMHVNNETGVIQDISAIGQFCRDQNILFHVDGAQSVGKIPVDVTQLNVDLMSISAHKMYGPKGQGALYVRRSSDVAIASQIHGGGHERGMRSGTLATHQIAGMGESAKIAKQECVDFLAELERMRASFLAAISGCDGIRVNGEGAKVFPGIINISVESVNGETLLMSLRELALSSGSACNSVSMESSYVLRAMGVSDELAYSSLRISFGRFSREEELTQAAEAIIRTVTTLRQARR